MVPGGPRVLAQTRKGKRQRADHRSNSAALGERERPDERRGSLGECFVSHLGSEAKGSCYISIVERFHSGLVHRWRAEPILHSFQPKQSAKRSYRANCNTPVQSLQPVHHHINCALGDAVIDDVVQTPSEIHYPDAFRPRSFSIRSGIRRRLSRLLQEALQEWSRR